eukprot:804543_1
MNHYNVWLRPASVRQLKLCTICAQIIAADDEEYLRCKSTRCGRAYFHTESITQNVSREAVMVICFYFVYPYYFIILLFVMGLLWVCCVSLFHLFNIWFAYIVDSCFDRTPAGKVHIERTFRVRN